MKACCVSDPHGHGASVGRQVAAAAGAAGAHHGRGDGAAPGAPARAAARPHRAARQGT